MAAFYSSIASAYDKGHAMPARKVPSVDVLKVLYDQGMSAREISRELNLNYNTVMAALRRYDLITRTTVETKTLQKERGIVHEPARYWLGKKQPDEMVEKRASQIRGDNHYLWKGGIETAKKVNRKPAASLGRSADGRLVKGGAHWREEKPYWNKEWLTEEYINNQRSAEDIALQFNVQPNAIFFWLHKHDIPSRSISEVRALKHWGSNGEKNPMFGRKRELSSNWKGGSTPERQAFYGSDTWQDLAKLIWERDKHSCQRCHKKASYKKKRRTLHIHHIISFAYAPLRAEPTNLVLLCHYCHRWVHNPKKNVDQQFILPIPLNGIEPRGGDAT